MSGGPEAEEYLRIIRVLVQALKETYRDCLGDGGDAWGSIEQTPAFYHTGDGPGTKARIEELIKR